MLHFQPLWPDIHKHGAVDKRLTHTSLNAVNTALRRRENASLGTAPAPMRLPLLPPIASRPQRCSARLLANTISAQKPESVRSVEVHSFVYPLIDKNCAGVRRKRAFTASWSRDRSICCRLWRFRRRPARRRLICDRLASLRCLTLECYRGGLRRDSVDNCALIDSDRLSKLRDCAIRRSENMWITRIGARGLANSFAIASLNGRRGDLID